MMEQSGREERRGERCWELNSARHVGLTDRGE